MGLEYQKKLQKCDEILGKYTRKQLKQKEWPSKGISNATRELLAVMLPGRLVDRIEEEFMGLVKVRYCGKCGESGHNSSTCKNYKFLDRLDLTIIKACEKTVTCKPIKISYLDLTDKYGNIDWDPARIDEESQLWKCENVNVNKLFCMLDDGLSIFTKRYFVGCVQCIKKKKNLPYLTRMD